MKRNWIRSLAACSVVLIALSSCGGMDDVAEQDENVIAPAGKDDNYFSNVAQEFYFAATPTILLADSYKGKSAAAQLERARKIMEGKTEQIGWFLHLYLIDKSEDEGEAGKYGGLRAMVLDGSYETDALKADEDNPLKFTYSFKVQVGGTKKLWASIRSDQKLTGDQDTFPLKIAKLSNEKVASFSHSGYGAGSWSPDTCKCDLEDVAMKVTPIAPSNDAYIDYKKMLADDIMDISVHFGWDYHARYDITHSRKLYEWLVKTMDFTSPATSYETYNRLSGPLTKKVTLNGRAVTMKVTIFRPDPCESFDEDGSSGSWAKAVKADSSAKKRSCPDYKWDDSKAVANSTTSTGAGNLMVDLKNSMKTRDAIIFSGHSGYTYAYALASWYKTSAGDLDPPEIKTMELPKDKSQLFVMSGCDTYHVAQAFKDNPYKKGLINADVITTSSFSNAGDVGDTQDIIKALVGDTSGKVTAQSYGRVMKNLNPTSYDYGWSFFTMYGVHGIDDNPLANPLGDATKGCTTCDSDKDCGAAGNVCVRLNSTEKVCAIECLHDKGCAEGQVCRQFGSRSSGYLKGMACVPKSLSCNVVVPPTKPQSYSASGTVERRKTKTYSVAVGSDAKNIVVTMTGTNDADLYTRFVSAPSTSKYDCRPYKGSSKETCKHDKSKGATLEIMVRGYSRTASKFELKVTWE